MTSSCSKFEMDMSILDRLSWVKARSKARTATEGTLSQAVRRSDIKKARYIGLAKTHLRHVLIDLSLNLIRVTNWLKGKALA